MLFEHNGYLLSLEGLPTWTQPSRVLEGNHWKSWETYSVSTKTNYWWPGMMQPWAALFQINMLVASKPATSRSSPSKWEALTALWIKTGSLTTCICNCYSQPMPARWLDTHTEAPSLVLGHLLSAFEASGEKGHAWQTRVCRIVKAEDSSGSLPKFLLRHLQATWPWTSHFTTSGLTTSSGGFENSGSCMNASTHRALGPVPSGVNTI